MIKYLKIGRLGESIFIDYLHYLITYYFNSTLFLFKL